MFHRSQGGERASVPNSRIGFWQRGHCGAQAGAVGSSEKLAERLVKEWLASGGWREVDLETRPKGDAEKTELAKFLRRHPPMSRQCKGVSPGY